MPCNACHFLLQPRDDLGGGRTPVRERLQIDQHAALAEGPAFADPIVGIVHVGIDHHDVAETLDPVGHGNRTRYPARPWPRR